MQQTLCVGSRYERPNGAYSVRRRQPLLHRVWPCSGANAPLSETTRTDTQGAGHVDTRGVYEPEVFPVSVSAGALEDYQLLKKRARHEFGGSSRRRLLSRDALNLKFKAPAPRRFMALKIEDFYSLCLSCRGKDDHPRFWHRDVNAARNMVARKKLRFFH